jgi:ribonuclease HII
MKTYHIYIDEAGRGPLAGPMYVGLIFPLKKFTPKEISLFKDSKKLSESQREECFTKIQQLQQKGKLLAVSAFATVKEIDAYGMTNAEHMAIMRGLKQLGVCNEMHPLHLIIDGKSDFNLKKHHPHFEITTIINGDTIVKEISMASIIAKVSRDRVMNALPKKYQKYGFTQHKGYGTQLHKEKIAQYGPSDIHRKLFLKWLFPHHTVQRTLPDSF